jgi:hypothetical protein
VSTITLTGEDIQKFSVTAGRVLDQSAGQIAQLRQSFPDVADADIQAMQQKIMDDPDVGTRLQPIDAAAYFIALHSIVSAGVRAGLDELRTGGTAATLHYLLLDQLPVCANIVNALTLLTRGGLATELHLDEAGRTARSTVARKGADVRHADANEAKSWVQQQWKDHGERFKHNKTEFARHYVPLVKEQYSVEVSEKTIRETWLAPSAIEN